MKKCRKLFLGLMNEYWINSCGWIWDKSWRRYSQTVYSSPRKTHFSLYIGDFSKNENIDAIEIVCHKDWLDEVERICQTYGITKKRWSCTGGDTFQESTMNGIGWLILQFTIGIMLVGHYIKKVLEKAAAIGCYFSASNRRNWQLGAYLNMKLFME